MKAGRRRRREPAFAVTEEFLARASVFVPCGFEEFEAEEGFLRALERKAGRTGAVFWAFDGRGAQVSSDEFAERIAAVRDGGRQELVVATGPASGWSTGARGRADAIFSLGRMTLPHGLAQAVVAEQIYRAMTILAGHPYHCGH